MSGTRGIVYKSDNGGIVSAHIDTGRHMGVSYSLAGRDIEDITGFAIEEYWYKNYFDPDDPVNKAAAERTAEQVITRYFEGVASGGEAMQLSTLCVERKLVSLFINLDYDLPYNTTPGLYEYLVGVEVLSIEKNPTKMPEGFDMYAVKIDAKLAELAKQVLDQDGIMTRFVSIGRENGMLRVFGDGTGP